MSRRTARSHAVQNAYQDDLAYVHDVGFGDFARSAAPGLLAILSQAGITSGLVIDLGCGSGIWARELSVEGYDVLGIDISPAMIAIAQARVPQGKFRAASFLEADLAPCVAVTALGEVFNFLFDPNNTEHSLLRFFRRIHRALLPGGLLIFDVAMPGRVPGRGAQRKYVEGADWAVLVEAEEDKQRKRLTRRITTFRKTGDLYRRSHEVHELRLFNRSELLGQLRQIGFRARTLSGYGRLRFVPGYVGFLARKSR
jgi:SAM-dependent methyltransferase